MVGLRQLWALRHALEALRIAANMADFDARAARATRAGYPVVRRYEREARNFRTAMRQVEMMIETIEYGEEGDQG